MVVDVQRLIERSISPCLFNVKLDWRNKGKTNFTHFQLLPSLCCFLAIMYFHFANLVIENSKGMFGSLVIYPPVVCTLQNVCSAPKCTRQCGGQTVYHYGINGFQRCSDMVEEYVNGCRKWFVLCTLVKFSFTTLVQLYAGATYIAILLALDCYNLLLPNWILSCNCKL